MQGVFNDTINDDILLTIHKLKTNDTDISKL